jgi:LuxR family transcriptional regulator, maltose regulon positive regulatory protein
LITTLSIWLAQGYLLMGEIQDAEKWLQKAASHSNEYYQLALARLQMIKAMPAMDQAALQHVLAILAPAIQTFEERGWHGYLIEAYNLSAIAHHTLGQNKSALADLQRALTLAEPQNEIYAFIKEGPVMLALLKQMPGSNFIRALLAGYPEPLAPSRPESAHPGLIEALTECEMEVLVWMAEGLTYQKISEQLWISVNTVRYHVKGLYRKLGVSSRAEAMTKAYDLNLLSSI